MQLKQSNLNVLKVTVLIFSIAVIFNYGWEIAQGFLYLGMSYTENIWWHCFIASLGDAILVLMIYLTGIAVFHHAYWFIAPNNRRYVAMVSVGLLIGLATEYIGVSVLHRWSYSDGMPIIFGTNIGIVPVLQMVALPPIIFALVSRLITRWAKTHIIV